MQARRFALTMNNWTEEKRNAVLQCDKFVYVILGEEIAPTSGTPHLQGYVECKRNERSATLGKKFHAHFEPCKGTQQQNIDYCKKGGLFIERGTPKLDGGEAGKLLEKERWARNIKLAEEGKLEELKEIDPEAYTRCYKTYKQMKQDAMKPLPALDHLENYWIWGPSGTGKSTAARNCCNGKTIYYPKPLNKWWDGYQGEKVVIIDDWEKDSHLDHHLKIWADHYDFIGECKGGSVRIRPEHIIVTSNYSPDECFSGVCLEAIRRRFKVHHFDKPFN